MRAEDVLRQFQLSSGSGDFRVAWTILLAVLALYALAFAAFYPRLATNDDEARYLRQTQLMLRGTQTATWIDPVTGDAISKRPSEYPVGTAALMAPFVWALGPEAAWIPSCLSLLAGVVLTGLWLRAGGRSPLWALIIPGFPASLALGRVAISDAPSLAAVALGLWLFWRGLDRGGRWWLASGFVAGASLLLRETNPLPFVPFYAGAVLRRERHAWALVVGGLAGVSLRLLSGWIAWGDPFFARGAGENGFGLHAIADNYLLHLLALFVFVPGGLIFALAYRGRRRPELVSSVVLFVLVYLLHWFGPPASGFGKRVVVELRYFVPVLPIFAFAMAESVPRLWRRLLESRPAQRAFFETTAAALAVVWIGGIAVAGPLANWGLHRWSATQAEIRDAIWETTGGESAVVTNWWTTKKFIRELDLALLPVHRARIEPAAVSDLARRHGEVFIVFLDRSDSAYHREDAAKNADFVAALSPTPELTFERRVTPTDHLRIWRMAAPEDAATAGAK